MYNHHVVGRIVILGMDRDFPGEWVVVVPKALPFDGFVELVSS